EMRALENDVTLSSGGAVAGRVVDPEGRGIGGAIVGTQPLKLDGDSETTRRLGRRIGPWVETDASGRFRLSGLEPGEHLVAALYLGRRASGTVKVAAEGEADIT